MSATKMRPLGYFRAAGWNPTSAMLIGAAVFVLAVPTSAQDLARYQKKTAVETLGAINLGNTFRTCSVEGERLKSKLYELQCLDELCEGQRLEPSLPLDEVLRRKEAAIDRLKKTLDADSLSKLRKGLRDWNRVLEEELQNERANPLTDKEDRFLAAVALSQTDCEKLECSKTVGRLRKMFLDKYDAVYRDNKNLFIKDKSEALARFEKEQAAFLSRYPKLAPRVAEEFKTLLELGKAESAEQINQRRANLSVLASFYGNAKRRDEFARSLPSLKEVWGHESSVLHDLSENFDQKIDRCLNAVAGKMATLPTSEQAALFRREVVAPTKKRLCSLLQKNLSEQSARFLCERVEGMDVVVPTAESTEDELKAELKSAGELWGQPVPNEQTQRRISSYYVDYPVWLKEGCISDIDSAQKRGLGKNELNDLYNQLTGKVHPSDASIKGRKAGFLAHEILHGVEQWMAAKEISSRSRQDKNNIDQCLQRKQPANPITSENFADLGMAVHSAVNEACLFPREYGEGFFEVDSRGHTSKLFRVLHVQSYSTKPLPASCQQFLESVGQKDLFKERCAVMP